MADLNEIVIKLSESGSQEAAGKIQAGIDRIAAAEERLQDLQTKRNKQQAEGKDISRLDAKLESDARALDRLKNSIQAQGEAAVKSTSSTKTFAESIKDAGAKAAEFNEGLLGAAGNTAAALAPLAAFVATIGVFIKQAGDLAQKFADTNEQIENAGKSSGATAETITALGLAAEEAGIGGLDTAATGLNRLRKAQDDAQQGSKETLDSLNRLAGGAANLDDVNVLFQQIAENVTATGGAAANAADIIKTFGRQGLANIGPLLDGFDQAKTRAREFGILIEGEVAESARKLDNVLDELNSRLKGASLTGGGEFAPAFETVALAANAAIKELSDPNITAGLKELAAVGRSVIEVTLLPLIAVAKQTAISLGFIGEVLGEIKGFFGGASEASKRLKEEAEGSAKAHDKLAVSLTTASDASRILLADLEKLQAFQKAEADAAATNAAKQIFLINEQVRVGVKSAEDAAKEIGAINEEAATKKADLDTANFVFFKGGLEQQVAANKEAIEQSLAADQTAAAKKKQLLEELNAIQLDFSKEEKQIAKDRLEASEVQAGATNLANARQIVALKDLQALKDANNKAADEKREQIAELDEQEKASAARRVELEQNVRNAQLITGQERITNAASVDAEVLKSRAKFLELEAQKNKAQLATLTQNAEEQKAIFAGIVKDRQERLDEINQAEQVGLQAIQRRLVEIALTVGLSDKERLKRTQQVEADRLALVNDAAEDRVAAEQNASDRVTANEIKTADIIFEVNSRLSQSLGKLSKATADEAINQRQREVQAAKDVAEDIKNVNKGLLEEIRLRKQNISVGTQQRDQQRDTANEVRDARENAFQGEIDAIANAEELARATSDVATATRAVNAELNKFREQNLGFVFDPEKLDEAKEKLKELQSIFEGLVKSIATEGFSALKQAAADETLSAINELFTNISKAQKAALDKQLLNEQNARIESATETAKELERIRAASLERQAELDRNARQTQREADRETEAQQNEAEDDRLDSLKEKHDAEAAENERFRKEQADKDQRDKDEALKREQDFANDAAKIRSDAKRENLEAETDAFVEITSLQNQLRDLEQQLGQSGLSANDQARLLAEKTKIDQALAEAQGKENARANAAKEKQAKIDQAIAEGGSSEELDAKIDAIEAEEELEKDRNAAILALGKNATKEQIAEVNRRFDELKGLLQADLVAQLALFDAQEAARVKQRADERTADQQAHTDRLGDANAAYIKDIEAINTRNAMALAAIGKRLDDELQAIKDQRKLVEAEAEAEARKLLEQIGIVGSAADDLVKKLKGGFGEVGEVIKGLIDQLKELTKGIQSTPALPGTTGPGSKAGGGAGGPRVAPSAATGGTQPAERRAAPDNDRDVLREAGRGKAFSVEGGTEVVIQNLTIANTILPSEIDPRSLVKTLTGTALTLAKSLNRAKREQEALQARGGFRAILGARS